MKNTPIPSSRPQFQPYAINDENSRGRIIDEDFHEKDMRTAFQHDRDRIIHSKAFRRLEAKTQVVLIHENDHSRTRLTHSLEVGQISESVAIELGLNTFATLAIALGHDIGHTPFGHTGERALSAILVDYGLDRFKHNYQGVLVVNELEKRYKKSNGLNLMWETRDGILKHSSLKSDIDLDYYDTKLDDTPYPATLEGQIVRIVDEIAQRTHDTDDGLRTNRINIEELTKQELVKNAIIENKLSANDIIDEFSKNKNLITSTLITSMMKYYVLHTIETAIKILNKKNIKTYDDVLKCKDLLIDWDENFKKDDDSFAEEFLRPRFYEHHEIKRMDSRAEYFLNQIFKAFKNHPKQLPQDTHKLFVAAVKKHLLHIIKTDKDNKIILDIKDFLGKKKLLCEETCSFQSQSKYPNKRQVENSSCPLLRNGKGACKGIRIIVNHIAGMTDRYAHLEYSRLYFPPEISRM